MQVEFWGKLIITQDLKMDVLVGLEMKILGSHPFRDSEQ